MIPPQHPGRPKAQEQPLKVPGGQLSGDAVLHQGVQGVAAINIHDVKETQLPARHQPVLHEVHGPYLARNRGLGGLEGRRPFEPPPSLVANRFLQIHLPIQTIDPLGVNLPALPSQQRGDAPIAKGRLGPGQFPDLLLKPHRFRAGPATTVKGGPGQAHLIQGHPQAQACVAAIPG